MRITRLEIFGFKSFVDRFVLDFDTELIAIVGPNGCGKSNIVDALRWVLGETHAKQLRGSLQEDLIFNGSDSRRPLGMAEVSITIRPDEDWQPESLTERGESEASSNEATNGATDEAAPLDAELANSEGEEIFEGIDSQEETSASEAGSLLPDNLAEIPGLFEASEIQLTRRLYRSGESEYFINKVPCRLRDMTELYRLIGLGARGLSIVQQGHIGSIVQKKPIERRELLEEAAGISGFRARLEASDRKLKKTSENMARLADIISEVEKQVRSLKRQADKAERRQGLKDKLKELELELFTAKASLITSRKIEAEEALAQSVEALEAGKSQASLDEAEEEKNKAILHELEVEVASLRKKRDSLVTELNRVRRSENESRVKLATVEGEKNALEADLARSAERLVQLVSDISQFEEGRNSRASELEEVEAQLQELEASDKSLGEREAKWLEDSRELQLNQKRLELVAEQAEEGSFFNTVKIPESLFSAFTNLLGERITYALGKSAGSDSSKGRIASRVSGEALSDNQKASLRSLGGSPIIDHLEFPEHVRSDLESLLSDTWLFETSEEAEAALKTVDAKHLVSVSSDGAVFFSWGDISSTSFPMVFGLEAGLDEMARAIEAEQQAQSKERAELEGKIRSLVARKSELRSVLGHLDSSLKAARDEHQSLESKNGDSQEKLRVLTESASVLATQLSVQFDQSVLSEDRKRAHDIEEQLIQQEASIAKLETELNQKRGDFYDQNSKFTSARSRLSSLEEKCSSFRLAVEKAQVEIDLLLEDINRQVVEEGEKVVMPGAPEIEALLERAGGDLGQYISQVSDEGVSLRRKLEREGEVDPESIGLYKEESERLESLKVQYSDLQSASESLQRTSRMLREISRKKFLETFEFVSKKYEELLPRLFGGGSGFMELINPDDPLTSGVNMSIRPPGKKLRSLELLSGGEKALGATAIIMAMFLYRPSPICVLDEVDAPLDDANLQRFLDLIKEISASTQFLVITHNKATMAKANRLIGITMQEKGISKALEVDFGAAEAELGRLEREGRAALAAGA